ncbi:hypothetical protein LAUMK191_00615 [Mycobacterium attenuatum]|uniref:hypothetical protein n=1 Tax=Mycobacterium attenuatum TaxID=2341086 RepID=UPI000F20B229|nr:hypothetical protein [Mycobacterium attenuatum]VBA46478.1 hypothetical protein LAUMK191_00615 [Mycobacterium attenuatum]
MSAKREASSCHGDAKADGLNRAASRGKSRAGKSPRQRARVAGVALGALALTSAASANLDVAAPESVTSSQLGVGRLAITLNAHEVFKLDTCTSEDPGGSVTTSTDDSDGMGETPSNNATTNPHTARIRIPEPMPIRALALLSESEESEAVRNLPVQLDEFEESSSESFEPTNPVETVRRIFEEIDTPEAEAEFRSVFTPTNLSSTRTAETPYFIPDVGWVDESFASRFRNELDELQDQLNQFNSEVGESKVGFSRDNIDDHLTTLRANLPEISASDQRDSSESDAMVLSGEEDNSVFVALGNSPSNDNLSNLSNLSNNNIPDYNAGDYEVNTEQSSMQIPLIDPYADTPDYHGMSVAALSALEYSNLVGAGDNYVTVADVFNNAGSTDNN